MKEIGINGWWRKWWNVVYSDKGAMSAYISLLLVRQESNASEMSVKWAKWMCMLNGGVSGKYRCSCWVPSRDSASEDVSLFKSYEAIWWCPVYEFWLLSYMGVIQTLSCIVYSIAQDWCIILIVEWLKWNVYLMSSVLSSQGTNALRDIFCTK